MVDIDAAVRQVREGRLEAYDEVVRAHQAELRAFIAAYCPEASQVDELAQRTFVWAYEHLAEYALGTRFHAWLKSIARNLLLAELEQLQREARQKQKYLRHLQALHAQQALAEDDGRLAERLRGCVEALPEHARTLLRERYEKRTPLETLARESGRDLAALKSALFRLRQALRRCVERKQVAPQEA